MKFELGQIAATPGALKAISDAAQTPMEFILRHSAGDWGVVDEHDRQENEDSVTRGFRILSVYILNTGEKIWIITEADRSATTILLPEDY